MLSALDRARLLAMGMRDDDLQVYGFGSRRPMAEAPQYLGYVLYREKVRTAFNGSALPDVTENKWLFYRFMGGFGVPVPETFGLYDPRFGVTWDGEPLQTADAVLKLVDQARPDGLVIKPAGGLQGYDVVILRDIDYDTGACVTQAGRPANLTEVVTGLAPQTHRSIPGYIVQSVAKQHSMLDAIDPHTMNTVRLMTLMTDKGVVVHGAVLRLGRAGSMADNWEQGGVAVAIDVATGVLGEGYLKPKHGGQVTGAHPDTGVTFQGQQLPMWDEAVEVCRRAAALLPGVRSIGWDLLLTDDGPVLIEANSDWDAQLLQVAAGPLLADPVFRREVEAAGVRLPRALPSLADGVSHVVTAKARWWIKSAWKRVGRS